MLIGGLFSCYLKVNHLKSKLRDWRAVAMLLLLLLDVVFYGTDVNGGLGIEVAIAEIEAPNRRTLEPFFPPSNQPSIV